MKCITISGILTAAIVFATPTDTLAGANAGAIAHLFWQVGTAAGTDTVFGATSGTPQLIVTVDGVHDLRGADIGLRMVPCGGHPLASAWQGNGTGGCNEGNWTFYVGGPGGFYPSAFTAEPAVPGMVVERNQEYFGPSACGLATDRFGYLWLHVEGSAGAVRNPNTVYGLWAIKFDLRGTALGGPKDCAGDLSDPAGPQGLFFSPCELFPCGGQMVDGSLALIDGNGQVDYAPFDANSILYWRNVGACGPPLGGSLCAGPTTPAKPETWGRVRTLYR